ncbi:MAG: hypothetical protein HS111_11470 [Kofleriaceae bacterium]|nr:hypothetical protein [Kofleriaceae bacterium]
MTAHRSTQSVDPGATARSRSRPFEVACGLPLDDERVAMLGQLDLLALAPRARVGGDTGRAVEDAHESVVGHERERPLGERRRHRVPVGVEAHERLRESTAAGST